MNDTLKPDSVHHYCVFLASPKDAQAERDAVRAYFDNLNAVQGSYLGVHFDVIDCENYGHIGAGEPQKRLKAIWDRYSGRFVLFVGIFKRRFGTPTSTHPSGTVEEYEWALAQFQGLGFPEILLFFYQPEGEVSFPEGENESDSLEQWERLKAFRVSLENGTAPCEVARFESSEDFEKVLRHNVDRWVIDPAHPWAQKDSGRLVAFLVAIVRYLNPRRSLAACALWGVALLLVAFFLAIPPGRMPKPPSLFGIDLLEISDGEFEMGSPYPGPENEFQHTVKLPEPFWIASTEVTVNQWYRSGIELTEKQEASNGDFPLRWVSWGDTQRFMNKLNEAFQKQLEERGGDGVWTNYVFRLPTEAEWEYACRASGNGAFSFPRPGALAEYGWYNQNSEGRVHRVGGLKPNRWGAYDMHGNVWEWCHDRYASKYYEESPGVNPVGPSTGTNRVMRGGSWDCDADFCRSAKRFSWFPDLRSGDVGFRVILGPPLPSSSQ